MIRVLLADDHALVRIGLEQLLGAAGGITVVAAAAGGREAVQLAAEIEVDVVLMDLSMPDLDGIAATRELRRVAPDAHVVVLTSFSDRERILDALDAGAVGYLLKDAEPDELLRGIQAAARGESPLAPKAAQELIATRRSPAPEEALTDRERQVLALLATGRANKAMAFELGVAEKTIKNHVSRIFQVLDVTDRTQAALWAQRHGLDHRDS